MKSMRGGGGGGVVPRPGEDSRCNAAFRDALGLCHRAALRGGVQTVIARHPVFARLRPPPDSIRGVYTVKRLETVSITR
jgi:hypothetical protein